MLLLSLTTGKISQCQLSAISAICRWCNPWGSFLSPWYFLCLIIFQFIIRCHFAGYIWITWITWIYLRISRQWLSYSTRFLSGWYSANGIQILELGCKFHYEEFPGLYNINLHIFFVYPSYIFLWHGFFSIELASQSVPYSLVVFGYSFFFLRCGSVCKVPVALLCIIYHNSTHW